MVKADHKYSHSHACCWERVVQIQTRWTPNEHRIADALQLSVLFWVGLLQRAITAAHALSPPFFFFFTNLLMKTARIHLPSCSFKPSSANASTVDSCICFKLLTFHFYLCSDQRLSLIRYQLLLCQVRRQWSAGKSPPFALSFSSGQCVHHQAVWKAWFKEDELGTAISHLFSIKHNIFSSDNSFFFPFSTSWLI